MKKGKEWLKAEVLGLRNNGNGETNQTAVEREIGRLQKWAWNNCVDRVYELINQLDEPEVLSQEWLDEHSALGQFITNKVINFDKFVKADKLQTLLVPNHEKMKVSPQEDRFITECKLKGYSLHELVHCAEVNDENCERLTRAWLDGYEVEEEQKYYALIKGHENIDLDDKYWNYCVMDESLSIGDNKVHPDVSDAYLLKATQYQWENLGINDTNADFIPVEEETEC